MLTEPESPWPQFWIAQFVPFLVAAAAIVGERWRHDAVERSERLEQTRSLLRVFDAELVKQREAIEGVHVRADELSVLPVQSGAAPPIGPPMPLDVDFLKDLRKRFSSGLSAAAICRGEFVVGSHAVPVGRRHEQPEQLDDASPLDLVLLIACVLWLWFLPAPARRWRGVATART
jgi:hypothetical protein